MGGRRGEEGEDILVNRKYTHTVTHAQPLRERMHTLSHTQCVRQAYSSVRILSWAMGAATRRWVSTRCFTTTISTMSVALNDHFACSQSLYCFVSALRPSASSPVILSKVHDRLPTPRTDVEGNTTRPGGGGVTMCPWRTTVPTLLGST